MMRGRRAPHVLRCGSPVTRCTLPFAPCPSPYCTRRSSSAAPQLSRVEGRKRKKQKPIRNYRSTHCNLLRQQPACTPSNLHCMPCGVCPTMDDFLHPPAPPFPLAFPRPPSLTLAYSLLHARYAPLPPPPASGLTLPLFSVWVEAHAPHAPNIHPHPLTSYHPPRFTHPSSPFPTHASPT